MIVFSTFTHMQTYKSADGKDSVTLPPRVRSCVADDFFDRDNMPEGLRFIESGSQPPFSSPRIVVDDAGKIVSVNGDKNTGAVGTVPAPAAAAMNAGSDSGKTESTTTTSMSKKGA